MNKTKAYLFQLINDAHNVIMAWENADVTRMFDMVNIGMYKYIGYVTYDTEERRVTDQSPGKEG